MQLAAFMSIHQLSSYVIKISVDTDLALIKLAYQRSVLAHILSYYSHLVMWCVVYLQLVFIYAHCWSLSIINFVNFLFFPLLYPKLKLHFMKGY